MCAESRDLLCREVRELSDPFLDRVEKTYNESFPKEERRDFALVKKMLESVPVFALYLLTKKEEYVGFMTVWSFERFAYVEHFAIDSSARNGGIGSQAIKKIIATVDLPVVLEVEKPYDELSARRIAFYERQGFVLDTHPYRQPPYHANGDWLDMHLMIRGSIDMQVSYQEVKSVIYRQVYGVE